jgi:hypothetical protein
MVLITKEGSSSFKTPIVSKSELTQTLVNSGKDGLDLEQLKEIHKENRWDFGLDAMLLDMLIEGEHLGLLDFCDSAGNKVHIKDMIPYGVKPTDFLLENPPRNS